MVEFNTGMIIKYSTRFNECVTCTCKWSYLERSFGIATHAAVLLSLIGSSRAMNIYNAPAMFAPPPPLLGSWWGLYGGGEGLTEDSAPIVGNLINSDCMVSMCKIPSSPHLFERIWWAVDKHLTLSQYNLIWGVWDVTLITALIEELFLMSSVQHFLPLRGNKCYCCIGGFHGVWLDSGGQESGLFLVQLSAKYGQGSATLSPYH